MEVLKKMGKYIGISVERVVLENFDNSVIIFIIKRLFIIIYVIVGIFGIIKKWIGLRKLFLVYMKIFVFDEVDYMLVEVI